MTRIVLLCILSAILLGLVFISPVLDNRGGEDFLVYWSAAHLLVIGQNPYDPDAMETLMHRVSPDRARGLGAAWNPPWLLYLIAPFGAIPFPFAVRVWLLVSFAVISLSIVWCWDLLHGPRGGLPVALVSGFLFGATLSTLYMGQVVGLVLLSIVLALRLLVDGRDYWAGAVLFFATIKPQLLYFLFFLMLLWVIRHRRWQVLVGGAVTLLGMLLLSWLVMPDWLAAYSNLMSGGPMWSYSTSTLDGLARAVFGVSWLRFAGVLLLPLAPAFLRLVDRFGWPVTVGSVLSLSLPLAPYGFDFDQILLLPILILVVKWLHDGLLPHRLARLTVAGLLVIYVVYLAQLTISGLPYHAFTWVPLAVTAVDLALWKFIYPLSCAPAEVK